MRPITVTSMLYRLWAAVRWPDFAAWQEHWLRPSQFWFRLGKGTMDAWAPLAAQVDLATTRHLDMVVRDLDMAKAFDRIPRLTTYALLAQLGLPPISWPCYRRGMVEDIGDSG